MPDNRIVSIIDDDASVRDATKDLVASLGHVAVTFESAEEFLHSPLADHTSCIITDVQMPGMKGYELQHRLITDGHRLPIIFITAFPEKAVRERVECAGALAYLEKPFDAATLIALIRTALSSDGTQGRH